MADTFLRAWQQMTARLDRRSAALIELAIILPVLAALSPPQPVRALAAMTVLGVLPGLALTRALALDDPVLRVAVTVSSSLALTVLTSTALFYAEIWSWQLCLGLLGVFTVLVAATLGPNGGDA